MDGARSALGTGHVSVSPSLPPCTTHFLCVGIGALKEGEINWKETPTSPALTESLCHSSVRLISLMKTMTYAIRLRQRIEEFSFIHGGRLFLSLLYDSPRHHQDVGQGSWFAYDNALNALNDWYGITELEAEILMFESKIIHDSLNDTLGNTCGRGEKSPCCGSYAG